MLICYSVVGAIVYVTLLLLGEMATQYPVAGKSRAASFGLPSSSFRRNVGRPSTDYTYSGSFTAYAARFVSPSYAFALGWNYWFNDAVSLAGDLVAAQLVVRFWLDPGSLAERYAWVLSVVFWAFLVCLNAIHVKAYGEMGE
jgi:AAT family amino acid transporter